MGSYFLLEYISQYAFLTILVFILFVALPIYIGSHQSWTATRIRRYLAYIFKLYFHAILLYLLVCLPFAYITFAAPNSRLNNAVTEMRECAYRFVERECETESSSFYGKFTGVDRECFALAMCLRQPMFLLEIFYFYQELLKTLFGGQSFELFYFMAGTFVVWAMGSGWWETVMVGNVVPTPPNNQAHPPATPPPGPPGPPGPRGPHPPGPPSSAPSSPGPPGPPRQPAPPIPPNRPVFGDAEVQTPVNITGVPPQPVARPFQNQPAQNVHFQIPNALRPGPPDGRDGAVPQPAPGGFRFPVLNGVEPGGEGAAPQPVARPVAPALRLNPVPEAPRSGNRFRGRQPEPRQTPSPVTSDGFEEMGFSPLGSAITASPPLGAAQQHDLDPIQENEEDREVNALFEELEAESQNDTGTEEEFGVPLARVPSANRVILGRGAEVEEDFQDEA